MVHCVASEANPGAQTLANGGTEAQAEAADQTWSDEEVTGKLDSYLEARSYLDGHESAALGIEFCVLIGRTPQ